MHNCILQKHSPLCKTCQSINTLFRICDIQGGSANVKEHKKCGKMLLSLNFLKIIPPQIILLSVNKSILIWRYLMKSHNFIILAYFSTKEN